MITAVADRVNCTVEVRVDSENPEVLLALEEKVTLKQL
jgi:hypothetical protein